MSRDILVIGDLASILERSPKDATWLPMVNGIPISLFDEATWGFRVGAPVMKEDGTMETFEEREAAYIATMGWKLDVE
jgi:hypothetical protein